MSPLHPRASELIRTLQLEPHPEGGFYRETWHWYEGEPLELLLASPDFHSLQRHRLGPVGAGTGPVVTAPADWWQAARPLGAYALCGCTVAPGFEFEDIAFLRDHPDASAALRHIAPELASLL